MSSTAWAWSPPSDRYLEYVSDYPGTPGSAVRWDWLSPAPHRLDFRGSGLPEGLQLSSLMVRTQLPPPPVGARSSRRRLWSASS